MIQYILILIMTKEVLMLLKKQIVEKQQLMEIVI